MINDGAMKSLDIRFYYFFDICKYDQWNKCASYPVGNCLTVLFSMYTN